MCGGVSLKLSDGALGIYSSQSQLPLCVLWASCACWVGSVCCLLVEPVLNLCVPTPPPPIHSCSWPLTHYPQTRCCCRQTLPTIFSKDEAVQELVLSAAAPAALMLALGWNNALEGCLLAADEQPFVVRMYPVAVAAALTQLARGYWAGAGLPGVWVALMTYYLVLLVGFAGRYWVYRGKL